MFEMNPESKRLIEEIVKGYIRRRQTTLAVQICLHAGFSKEHFTDLLLQVFDEKEEEVPPHDIS